MLASVWVSKWNGGKTSNVISLVFSILYQWLLNDYQHLVTESNHFISSWAMHCLSANLLRHAKWTTLTIVLLLLLAQFQISSLLSQTLSLYLSNSVTAVLCYHLLHNAIAWRGIILNWATNYLAFEHGLCFEKSELFRSRFLKSYIFM